MNPQPDPSQQNQNPNPNPAPPPVAPPVPVTTPVTSGPGVSSLPPEQGISGTPEITVPSRVDEVAVAQTPNPAADPYSSPVLDQSISEQSPAANSQDMPSSAQRGKSKRKLLAVVLIVFGAVLVLAVGVLVFMQSQKTSAEALDNFNSAVSTLNSKISSFTLKVGVSSGSASDSELESSAKDLNSAVLTFEEATGKLKSDKKSLKEAAAAYTTELKNFNTNIVPLAVETAKVEAVGKKMGQISVASSATSSEAAFLAELARVSSEYTKYSTEMRDLKLENSDAKELRDAFVSVSDQFVSMLGEVKTAFINRDRTALTDIQNRISKLDRDNPAIKKEDEISEKLGADGEILKKVDAARKSLNEEISRSNSAS